MRKTKKIYLISDSTGELADRFTHALLTQFPHDRIQMKKFTFVDNEKDAQKIISRLSPEKSILFHTVLPRKLKRAIGIWSKKRGIPAFDLTGPPTDFVVKYLKTRPVWNVSTIHRVDEEYGRRIDAIEYTIAHDDGAGNDTLAEADVILVGPSRSSKTPTSIYLAMKGCRVANIPLIREVGLSDWLAVLKADPRVIGFVIGAEKLCEMRMKRVAELGTSGGAYTDLREIHKEIQWTRKIYKKYLWKTIDVTDRAIEETAALILRQIQRRV